MNDEIKKLEELCKPIAEYLKQNHDPYCSVIISDSHIKLLRDEIGIPILESEMKKMNEFKKEVAQAVPVQEQLNKITEAEILNSWFNVIVPYNLSISQVKELLIRMNNELERIRPWNHLVSKNSKCQ